VLNKTKETRDKLVASLDGTREFLNFTRLGAKTGLSKKFTPHIGNMLMLPRAPPSNMTDQSFWMIFSNDNKSLADGQPVGPVLVYELNYTTIDANAHAEAARVASEAPGLLCARKPYEVEVEYRLSQPCGGVSGATRAALAANVERSLNARYTAGLVLASQQCVNTPPQVRVVVVVLGFRVCVCTSLPGIPLPHTHHTTSQ
jgi:hypothetical protein